MSLTLTQPTGTLLPAFNRINYNLISTNADQTGFKYVVKVYNGADELMATAYYDSPANPADAIQFDISKFVQTNFAYTKGILPSGTAINSAELLQSFYIKCYEYYEVGGVFAIILDTEVVSATKIAFAGAFPLLELKGFNEALFNGSDNTTYKPLSDWSVIKLRSSDSQVFAFYNNGKITSLGLKIYLTNNTISNQTIAAPAYTTNTITYFKVTPLTYGSVDRIEVTLNYNNGSARVANIAKMYIQACGKYEPMRLAYLNRYGAYDFLNFDLVSRTSFDIERKSYQKDYTDDVFITGSNIVKNLNPVYYVKEMQKWRIISDYLTDEQSVLARQLYSSPLVYMNLVNDNFVENSWVPVKLTPNSYEMKKTISDKLFNLELDLEFGLVNTRQSI